jgi:hypothetical protein
MGRRTTVAAPLGLALVCGLLLLGGCGGSDDSSSTSTATSTEAASEGQRDAGGDSASTGGGQSQKKAEAGAGSEAETGNGADGSNDARVTPLEVSGGGSEQFRVKGGGDNSVQEFGDEGDEGELEEAAEIVHDFYAARANGEWAAACALLSESLLERLRQLAEKTPGVEDARCAPFLASFTADLPASEWRLITTIDAGSLRHEGEQGFLIYYGPDRTVYAMPLLDEDGTWKINALSSAQLPGAS